uniref:Ion_trans domain-containing protein n=1 Tax=Macrostomum lignano TaxID=282301 RepID=A0A1I8JP16_9PLAT
KSRTRTRSDSAEKGDEARVRMLTRRSPASCHIIGRGFRKWNRRSRRLLAAAALLDHHRAGVSGNTVVLATQYYNQPRWLENLQNKANYVFVAMFTFEMLLKMYSLGIRPIIGFLFKQFDFFVVVASLSRCCSPRPTSCQNLGISVLRCARLLRVFKVTRYWSSLRNLLFGGRFNFETSEKPRSNFDSFWQSLVTRVPATEASANLVGIMVSFYFVILFICGNYILLNVFLAIAVGQPRRRGQLGRGEERARGLARRAKGPAEKRGDAKKLEGAERRRRLKSDGKSADEEEGDEEGDGDEDGEGDAAVTSCASPTRLGVEHENQDQSDPRGVILVRVFSSTNRFRVLCHKICNHSYFGSIVLVCILVSSAMLAAEEPVNSDNNRNKILNKFDYFFTTVFTIEIILKVTAYGLVLHEGRFCRQAFNLLDILVVLTSVVVTYGVILHKGSFCRSTFNLLDLLVVFVALISLSS